ncbi:hypothetical protein NMS_2429 [Nonlabens marinus S1-08]|uniref:Uncharacterized protein n=2 Tax=Nonlabens TaxID=363408 RepID=W8VWL2_9FLAO|nr:hypothetical protein NMS_2429 [Nonlabens marinus S1-08]
MTSSALSAQDYIAPEPNDRQMEEAKMLTQVLNDELSLTEKQILQIEKLNGEFIARRDIIVGDQGLTIVEKNEFLESIYVEQGNEMADILAREQLNLYKRIRGDLQPLVVIVE